MPFGDGKRRHGVLSATSAHRYTTDDTRCKLPSWFVRGDVFLRVMGVATTSLRKTCCGA